MKPTSPTSKKPSEKTGIHFAEDDELKLKEAKEWATGLPAVQSSLKHVYSQAGLVRGSIALSRLNQKKGFDCPSCAWPDPDDHRAPAEFCENGAKAVASETTLRVADPAFFAQHSIHDLNRKSDAWHESQGRLTTPMIRKNGDTHYRPCPWQEAFDLIASELKALPHANDGIFYTSGRTSNEAAFIYQLMVRQFGTNNLPDCSNMCHESSGFAMGQAVGIGKGTVSLADLENADVIISVGQNPGTNHPRMLTTFQKAVKKGAEIVAINPLKEAGLIAFANPQHPIGLLNQATPLTSLYLQVAPNGDHALFRAIAYLWTQWEDAGEKVFDHEFIKEHTAGLDDYLAAVRATDYEQMVQEAGLTGTEIETLARLILKGKRRLVTCWAMGLTQQQNAVATISEVINLHLLIGALGREGAGLCPVRGHSNVQGDRTMGIFENMPPEFHDRLDEVCQFQSPRDHGLNTVMAIRAMHKEPGKVFFAMGGNFLQASPDTRFTEEALQNCRLTCHVSTKLNRSHLVTGEIGIILPCFGRSDLDEGSKGPQFLTCENSMGVVQASRGSLTPVSADLKGEPAIVAGLATALIGDTEAIQWSKLGEDYGEIRNLIEKVIPGFENFNERASQPGGFYLPNSVKERVWNTETGKANFNTNPVETRQVQPGRLLMQTLRSHDQYNTTVYGMDDRYRGIGHARCIIFLNPSDMQERGLKPTQPVDITSHWEDGERYAKGFQAIPYDIPPGSAATYFPEANVLVPLGSYAKNSETPTSKGIEISIVAS